MADIVTDLGVNKNWKAYKNGHNNFTITLTLSGAAFNISTYVFSLEIFTPGGDTSKLTLTEGSGITNGGATGILTIVLTQTQASTTLPRSDYFYVLSYVKDSVKYRMLQGNLVLSTETNPASASSSVTQTVSLSGSSVSAAITLSGGSMTGAQILTAFGTKAANLVLVGPASGAAAEPTFRTLVAADVPTALHYYTSDIYSDGVSFQAFQQRIGPGAVDMPIEILNIGYSGHGETDDIHENTTGLVRLNGRLNLVRNMQWDQANAKWLTPLQGSTAFGSVCVELGGEAVILHATPSGVNFSDVPHEILLASARGTDGPTAEKITSGYFVQIKAPLFARFDSAAYDPATTANTWNDTAGTHPLVWLSTGEAKGTETELMRIEGNNATGGLYFKRSNGTLASRTIASANASAGKICWAFYDGADFETTAQIDGISDSSVASNDMGGKIRFHTSPNSTGNLTVRMEIRSDGAIYMVLPTASGNTGELWNDSGTVKIAA